MEKHANWRDDFFELQSHRHYNLIIFATGVLIFLFIPLFIVTPELSKQIFNNGREVQVVFDILILIVVFYLAIAAIYWAFSLVKYRDLAASLVRFLFCWVALSGFLFPLTTSNSMFETMGSSLHILNFVLVLILTTGLTILWGSKYAKTITIFLVTFLTIAIVPTIPRAVSKFEKQSGETHQLKLSKDNNLLVVGMDGVPGHIMADLLQKDAGLENEFKDFTFYENVAATSPATEASLMGIIYGNHDFTKWADPFPIDRRSLYFNDADKFNLYTLSKYNVFNDQGTKLSAGRYGIAEQRDELFELYRNVTLRLFSKNGLKIVDGVDVAKFPDRGGQFFWTVKGYDTIVDSLTLGSDRPAILFAHFTFTHWPTSMDQDCVYQRLDKDWMRDHSNKNGVVEGAKCALDKYKELIGKLKSLGTYDSTTIVLYSDHGKPVVYYNEPPYNYQINGNLDYGFDRYKPFLMIKPAHAQKEEMAYADRIVLLDDLAQTTCYIMDGSDACENAPGVNILDESDITPDDFFIHVVKDVNSRWSLEGHIGVQISRKIPLEAAMRESGEINLTEPPKN
jgi:hypothetical protein